MYRLEAFSFIARFLALRLFPGRKEDFDSILRNNHIPHESLVKECSGQFVMPAFYIQLKANDLMGHLPEELLSYFSHIHELNSHRNKQILQQSEELIHELNSINIQPVILKGVANLFSGLYKYPGERMIGDIDILLKENEIIPAVEHLKKVGYHSKSPYLAGQLKSSLHYPKLIHEEKIAEVEIHRQLLHPPYQKLFSAESMYNMIDKVDGIQGKAFIPANEASIVHNILNIQLNDRGYTTGMLNLRQMYDLMLLAEEKDVLQIIHKYRKLYKYLFNGLALTAHTMDLKEHFNFKGNEGVRNFQRSIFINTHPNYRKVLAKKAFIKFMLRRYSHILIRSIINKDERKALAARVFSLKWYRNHFRRHS